MSPLPLKTSIAALGFGLAALGCTGPVDVKTEEVGQLQEALSGTYEIKSVHSNKCVDVAEVSTANGANIHQWDCVGGANQKWVITNLGGNLHKIEAVHSGKAMDADNSGGNGTNVHQWTYGGGANQKWYIEGGGPYTLKPSHNTGQCLDVQDFSTSNGGNIQTWSCSGNNNQKFDIVPTGGGGGPTPGWHVDFIDEFDSFNTNNWQDQILWVNNEHQCYVPDNQWNTREVSNGTLKLRVVNIGYEIDCQNWDKWGNKHPNTRYVAGRIASKNKKEFVKGKWTARIRLFGSSGHSGKPGMFPAWWLLGYRNNEPPVQQPDENVCWPLVGSGEVDIMEHYGSGGPNKFTARGIKNLGYCDGGDWQTYSFETGVTFDWSYHSYSVEWSGNNLIFRTDDNITGQFPIGNDYPEPMFAILNYAKITNDWMDGEWGMEVNWVKHEYWQ